jgi:hypothetical protein
MNASTHTIAATGGGAVGAALAGVISATWHVDPSTAADWVVLLGGFLGAVGPACIAFAKWKWPGMPIPGDEASSEKENANEAI